MRNNISHCEKNNKNNITIHHQDADKKANGGNTDASSMKIAVGCDGHQNDDENNDEQDEYDDDDGDHDANDDGDVDHDNHHHVQSTIHISYPILASSKVF